MSSESSEGKLEVGGVVVHLAHPDAFDVNWVGQ